MPLTKDPCSSCKAKHVKCITDDDRSECRRCVTKAIQCCRPARKAFFRPGSSARYDTQFSDQQNWVSSNAREYRIQKPSGRPSRHIVQDEVILPPDILTEVGITESHPDSVEHAVSNDRLKSHDTFPGAPHCDTSVEIPPILDTNSVTPLMRQTAVQIGSRQDLTETESTPIPELPIIRRCQPFKDIQEACLLRYYVEELSHWFDTCDEQKHFQQLVPIWARRFPPLLQAIFATSARHLSRLPKYRTSQGVLYCGQLLPNVTSSSAVEYMLTCIPALREFHDTQDEEHREYIMATAVILRQFEEMEDDEDDINLSESLEGPDTPAYPQNRGNFLAIINTVVRSSYSEDLFRRQGLFSAAYWIALRQEVYYAFTRGQSPQMILLPSTLWQDATIVNKMIMHTAQVAKWFRTDKSEQEWRKLKPGLFQEHH
ncbi:ArcA-like protein [Phlyctema vagabunda]|uniref:ArcA-like protein n=1 Tax=Phlyctema vagabunda TaxID=108571 RepID=A0ABR4PTK1_9HELO